MKNEKHNGEQINFVFDFGLLRVLACTGAALLRFVFYLD